MKNYILIGIIIGIIIAIAIIFQYVIIKIQQEAQLSKLNDIETGDNIEIGDCVIQNPDPDGYLFKICQYLKAHHLNVSPANPTKYKIIGIEEGEYSRWENGKKITTEAIIIKLNCCYLGDFAFIDKKTKEVIGFRVGAK